MKTLFNFRFNNKTHERKLGLQIIKLGKSDEQPQKTLL